jgi:hypothetical protein
MEGQTIQRAKGLRATTNLKLMSKKDHDIACKRRHTETRVSLLGIVLDVLS